MDYNEETHALNYDGVHPKLFLAEGGNSHRRPPWQVPYPATDTRVPK